MKTEDKPAEDTMEKETQPFDESRLAKKTLKKKIGKPAALPEAAGNNTMLAQVVGIILGSPEFQRR